MIYQLIYQKGGSIADNTSVVYGLTWKKAGGIGPPGMPSPGGIPPITGLGAAAAL